MKKYMFYFLFISMALSTTSPTNASKPGEDYSLMSNSTPAPKQQLTKEIKQLESAIQRLDRESEVASSHGEFGRSGECFTEICAKQREIATKKKLLSEMN